MNNSLKRKRFARDKPFPKKQPEQQPDTNAQAPSTPQPRTKPNTDITPSGTGDGNTAWQPLVVIGILLLLGSLQIIVSLIDPAINLYSGNVGEFSLDLLKNGRLINDYIIVPKFEDFVYYLSWVAFQALLFVVVPGKRIHGQITPAGNTLYYKLNGYRAWCITVLTWCILLWMYEISPTIIYVHWPVLITTANFYGALVGMWCGIKAKLKPQPNPDRKFRGNQLLDAFFGIELNPRLWNFDLKLFHITRLGAMSVTLIDLSYAAVQFRFYRSISVGTVVVLILHQLYIVDFLRNEERFLRTITITRHRFGIILGWWSCAFWPALFTLHTQYLAWYPGNLSLEWGLTLLLTGWIGYYIYSSANAERYWFRLNDGNCLIGGYAPLWLFAGVKTTDGKTHTSRLLCSGWWRTARHINYFGDIIMALSMCAACGFKSLFPWLYGLFLVVFLVIRAIADEEHCRKKYPLHWRKYSDWVKWRMIPYVW